MFQAPKLTNAGKALYYSNMAGEQIKFTTIQLGSGTLSGAIATMTALVNKVVTINATVAVNDGYVDVAGAFSNTTLIEGFYWREIGVFAADPNYPDDRNKDILYCYQNAYDTADYIPVASVETVEKSITVPVIVGDATAVSCTISKSLVYTTTQDMEAHNASGTAHADMRALIQTNATAAATAKQTADNAASAASAAQQAVDSAAAKAATHAAQHASGGSDPVTPAAIGSAEAIHNHDDRYYTKDETLTTVTVSGTAESVSTLAPLSVGRESLAAATDGNGNVLFGGGYGSTYSDVVDKYDTDGNRTTLTPLSVGRKSLAAATDGNGNVLFGGGYNGSNSAVVDKYDTSDVRTTLTNLSYACRQLAAATDGNGNVLFGGGYSTTTTVVVNKYDTSGTRTTLTPLSVGRESLAAATDGNGNVLFGGGNNSGTGCSAVVDKYDTDGNRITLTPLSVGRKSLAAATDRDGNVLFGGGSPSSGRSAVVDKYDLSGVRTTLIPLSIACYGQAAATDRDGNVLFGGGSTSSGRSAVVDKYDTDGNRITLTPLSAGRESLAAATDGNGNVLFGGGIDSEGIVTSAVDMYLPPNSPATISIPPYTLYKFQEHSEEQRTLTGSIKVNTPNTGYFRFGGTIEL